MGEKVRLWEVPHRRARFVHFALGEERLHRLDRAVALKQPLEAVDERLAPREAREDEDLRVAEFFSSCVVEVSCAVLELVVVSAWFRFSLARRGRFSKI